MVNSKIHLLYITDTFRQRSGITAVIRNYMTHFDWNRIQVDLLVNDDSEEECVEQMRHLGANVYYMPILNINNIVIFFNFVRFFFNEHHYDIVHSHYYQLDCMVFPIAKRLCSCKCISHSHNTKYSEYLLKGLRNRLLCYKIDKVSDVWAACSNDAGEFLFGKNFSRSPKKLIVRNGIECTDYIFDLEKRKRKRREFGIKDSEIVLGHIGRMAPQKNPLFLINILNELVKIDSNYRLMMVGNGPMESEIKKMVDSLGLKDKVYFAGVRSDVPELINAFDIFLFPSLYEGLGIVAVEAQANGLNCLVSDVIPREVDLTGIRRLSLEAGPLEWAKEITHMSTTRCVDNYRKVVDAGYDIQSAANYLLDYYCNLIRK